MEVSVIKKIDINKIIVGSRFRQDVGDLSLLINSINDIGLMHPIVINSKNELIAGFRRLSACKQIGWREIDVNVIDIDAIVKGEFAENVIRKDFTPSEMVAIYEEIQSYQGQKDIDDSIIAEPRQKRAAKQLGIGHDKLSKAKQVVEAAKRDPVKFAELQNQMDNTGNVEKAYKTMKREQLRDSRVDMAKGAKITSKLINDDFREMGKIIADDSIDLIYTDPPYPQEFLPLYADLSLFASRVLKPGGLCIAYTGHYYLPQVINNLSEYLTYLWMFIINLRGQTQVMRPVSFMCMNRPLLVFYKPPLSVYWPVCGDTIDGYRREKDGHEWQQGLLDAKHFIEIFCPPTGIVCDPFAGAGTFLLAAKQLNLNYIGFEIDKQTHAIATNRLNNENI